MFRFDKLFIKMKNKYKVNQLKLILTVFHNMAFRQKLTKEKIKCLHVFKPIECDYYFFLR